MKRSNAAFPIQYVMRNGKDANAMMSFPSLTTSINEEKVRHNIINLTEHMIFHVIIFLVFVFFSGIDK